MTREEALALYRPIRAAIKRILSAAVPACNQADLTRSAKQLGLWAEGKIFLAEEDIATEMLSDIALFEPNQRGRRAFDHFLADKARQLDAVDFVLAQRMGKALFSLFRCTARHGTAGIWINDLLDGNRSLWLMDEAMEATVPTGEAFGMRLFDGGEFHVGFGIVVSADEETTQFSVQAKAHGGRLPFRHSLAATLYGDSLRDSMPIGPELEDAFASLLGRLTGSGAGSRREIGNSPALRQARLRGRK
jgi:hypothetical protein